MHRQVRKPCTAGHSSANRCPSWRLGSTGSIAHRGFRCAECRSWVRNDRLSSCWGSNVFGPAAPIASMTPASAEVPLRCIPRRRIARHGCFCILVLVNVVCLNQDHSKTLTPRRGRNRETAAGCGCAPGGLRGSLWPGAKLSSYQCPSESSAPLVARSSSAGQCRPASLLRSSAFGQP